MTGDSPLDRPLRLIHVTPSYLPATRYGGPIYSVHGLCKALVARGHDVMVFTTSIDGAGDSPVPLDMPQDLDGVKVRYFASRHLRRLVWAPSMLPALHDAVRHADLVHTHSVFLWPTWAGARVARQHRVPYVLSPRGMLVPDLIRRRGRLQKTLWINAIERRNIRHAAAIHFTAPLEQNEFQALRLPSKQDFVIPNGLEPLLEFAIDDVSPAINEATRQPFILMLGRISWKKGFDIALPAIAKVAGARLLIVGPDDEGYLPTVRSLIGQLGLGDRATILGPVVGSDKQHILRKAALLLLPSYSENFGNVVTEAMQVGCPVVVTQDVGAATLVTQAGAGTVVATRSTEALAAAIAHLYNNPQVAIAMGERGSQFAERELRWYSIAGHMAAEYRQIIAGHHLKDGDF